MEINENVPKCSHYRTQKISAEIRNYELKQNRTSRTKKYSILKCIEMAEDSVNLKIQQSKLSNLKEREEKYF